MSTTTRRRFLAGAGAASVGAAVAASPGAALAHPGRGRAVRILHFTDAHVTPDIPRSEPETKRALQLGLRYRPDLVLQSRRHDLRRALRRRGRRVDKQWARAPADLQDRIRTPVAHAIGNHDCWSGRGRQPTRTAARSRALRSSA